MAINPDYNLKIIHSDASITDMVEFHDALRDIEASDQGVLSPTVHTYKEVQLGGGAIFPAVAFVNGWTLQFPAGNWIIKGGNLAATINPVPGCFVDRTQSAAYAVSSAMGGSSGPTAEEIALAVWSVNSSSVFSVNSMGNMFNKMYTTIKNIFALSA
jgi:hypothetical protein